MHACTLRRVANRVLFIMDNVCCIKRTNQANRRSCTKKKGFELTHTDQRADQRHQQPADLNLCSVYEKDLITKKLADWDFVLPGIT